MPSNVTERNPGSAGVPPASTVEPGVTPCSTMREVLETFPGAQRALFRGYHIGGCSNCGFQPEETLEQLCARNGNLDVNEVLEHIKTSHEQDAKVFITPLELADWLKQDSALRVVDVRS